MARIIRDLNVEAVMIEESEKIKESEKIEESLNKTNGHKNRRCIGEKSSNTSGGNGVVRK